MGVLRAARLEGIAHVIIIRFDHLSEAQKRAYVIADNKIAEQAGWNCEMLAIELGELINLLPLEELDVSITGLKPPRSICCSRTWRGRGPNPKMPFRLSLRRQ